MSKKIFILLIVMILTYFCTGCKSKPVETPSVEPITETAEPVGIQAEVYLVGEEGYTPISYMENGEVVGISPDIIIEAFNRMGVTVRLELMPWERCKQMVLDGKADGFFTPYLTPEREKNYHFVYEPVMIEKNVFVVKADSDIAFDGDIKSLSNYTIGTVTGYATLEAYIKEGSITQVNYSTDTAEALKKLISAGRGVDLFVNTNYIIWDTAKQLGLSDKIKELDIPLVEIPSFLAFTKEKDMSDIARQFERTLKALKADGTYDEILKKYISNQ